ncbi:MAG: transposase [Phycisphaerales bacterium]
MHRLSPNMTTWHITWGTYGARLHGGDRATVDRREAAIGDRFVGRNEQREQAEKTIMRGDAVYLDHEQRRFVESTVVQLCDRGGWTLRTCASGIEGDHIHVLVDADPAVHGEKIRRLLKRWLTQAMNERFARPRSGKWWAVQGSNRVVDSDAYLSRVIPYIDRQRATSTAPM